MAINSGSFPKALVGGKGKSTKKKEPAVPSLAQLGSVAASNKRTRNKKK